jgi:hypothetical protein
MEANARRADDLHVRTIALAVAAALLAGVLAMATPAQAEEPPFVDWTSLLPSLTTTYQPSSAKDSSAGRPSCVRSTIREMERPLDPLAHACNPNALFPHA